MKGYISESVTVIDFALFILIVHLLYGCFVEPWECFSNFEALSFKYFSAGNFAETDCGGVISLVDVFDFALGYYLRSLLLLSRH